MSLKSAFTSNEFILAAAFGYFGKYSVILCETLCDTWWFMALSLTLKSYAYSYIKGISITITLSYTEKSQSYTELINQISVDLCEPQ